MSGETEIKNTRMSAEGLQALAQIKGILGMDSNPLRFDWMRQDGECLDFLHVRRQQWLRLSGCSPLLAFLDWDDLLPSVREKLSGVGSC